MSIPKAAGWRYEGYTCDAGAHHVSCTWLCFIAFDFGNASASGFAGGLRCFETGLLVVPQPSTTSRLKLAQCQMQ